MKKRIICLLMCIAVVMTSAAVAFADETGETEQGSHPANTIVEEGGSKYYTDSSGNIQTDEGFVTVDGQKYFVQSGGEVAVSKIFSYGGAKYYANASGVIPKAGTAVTFNGSKYYITTGQKLATKYLRKVSGKYYYYDANGKMVRSAAYKYKGKYYFATSSGSRKTTKGWATAANKKKYYVKSTSGVLYTNHLAKIKKKYYAFGTDAALRKSTVTIRGITFYPNKKTGVVKKSNRTKVYRKGTYIVTDISAQKLSYYKKGKLVFSTNVVTGKKGRSGTPKGLYKLHYKNRNVRLIGPTWNRKVSYWMAFIGQEYGFHDASWRTNWKSDAYLTQGSAGCVNMPKSGAKKLYKYAKRGTYVWIQA